MAWSAPRTWVTSEVVTAAQLNQEIRDNLNALNGFVRKTTDESITSSTAVQNDDHLLYTIGATGTYVFDLYVRIVAGNAAGDIQVGFSFPTGTLDLWGPGIDPAIAAGTIASGKFYSAGATSGTFWTDFGASATATGFNLHGLLQVTATGTLTFQWAQFASNATATTVKAQSHLIVKQVA
jgi:hypothetical protein